MNAGRLPKLNGMWVLLALLLAVLSPASPAEAQTGFEKFLAGAAVALVAHESGHLLLDTVFDAGPGLKTVHAGPIPFFAITHHPVSPVREFAISSAGFWVQHATDELILTRRPRLRHDRAPFLKGVVAFNVLTSAGYSIAAFSHRGPTERDTRGMASSARLDERWIGAMILGPALLDAARYYRGDVRWLRWASRATKVGGALLIIRAAN
jgi:hypothetical protein